MTQKVISITVATDDHRTLLEVGKMFQRLGNAGRETDTPIDYAWPKEDDVIHASDIMVGKLTPAPITAVVTLAPAPPVITPIPDTQSAVATPTAAPPVAPVTLAAAPSAELDSDGLPWDARIHSSSKARLAKTGQWKLARNVDVALVAQVIAELKAMMASQVTVAAPPAPPVAPVDTTPRSYSGAQSGGYQPPPAPPVAPVTAPAAELPPPPPAAAPAPPVAPVAPNPLAAAATAPTTTELLAPSATAVVESAPTGAVAAPTDTVAAVEPPPAAAVEPPTTFPAFLQAMTALQNSGRVTNDQLLKVLNAYGIPNPALLNAKRDLIPTVFQWMQLLAGGTWTLEAALAHIGGAA